MSDDTGRSAVGEGERSGAQASSRQLTITYVLSRAPRCGGVRVVLEHLRLLHGYGHDAALFAKEDPSSWFDCTFPVRRFAGERDLIAALSLRAGIKVATLWKTAPWVLEACDGGGAPVYFVQDIESSFFRGDPRGQATVMDTYSPRFRYLTPSLFVAEWLKKVFGYEATVAPPAIDHAVFHPTGTPRAGDCICAIHRSNPLKGFDLTLDAFRQLRVPARLICFGAAPPAERGVTFVREPSDEQVAEIYSGATVFIQTSVHEGFCLPLLEAMACGCPVVTTDAHGNMAFCRDEENCLLVPGHDAALVARVLERLLGDAALQERLRQAGLETARKYTWGEVGLVLEAFYQSVGAGSTY